MEDFGMISMGKYDVKLGNGREIKGADCYGSIYHSSERLSREDFAGGLGRVEIVSVSNPESDRVVLERCRLELLEDAGSGSDFWVSEIPPERLKELELEGNIEYLAMMTGVEL